MSERSDKSSKRKWIFRGVGAAVVLAIIGFVGVPYVYVHFINKPAPRLSFDQLDAEAGSSDSADTSAAAADVASSEASTSDGSAAVPVADTASEDASGAWAVSEGSAVGYRVKEELSGQATEGVGRTSTVEGSITVSEGKLASAEFSVDVASMKSDSSRRDSQFTGRIMNTEEFPVASFASTSTPDVVLQADGATTSATVDGVLTLHGVEKTVTVTVEMRKVDDSVQLQGSIPVTFADYDIDNPSIGPVKTGDTGEIEFLLIMKRAA